MLAARDRRPRVRQGRRTVLEMADVTTRATDALKCLAPIR